MKIAIIGRTALLLKSAHNLAENGHQIVLVSTAKPAEYYDAGVDDFRQLAERHGAQFAANTNVNGDEFVQLLKSSEAEIGVSVNWPTVIGAEPIAALRHGILNAHAGDLPRYRGNACPNWAILNGETHVGLCVHEMEAGKLDSGAVVTQERFPIGSDTYIGDVYEWLESAIPRLFVAAVTGLERGTIAPKPQPTDPSLALRCYPRRPEDSRIDWRQDVFAVHRLVRASSHPFAGAFSTLDGGPRVVVWRAEPYNHPEPFLAVPGQILLRAGDDPVVACGNGALRLVDIAADGVADGTDAKRLVARNLRARLI